VPFEGISLASDNDRWHSVVINVGKTSADHVSHKIDHPVHIWLQQTEAGADAALEIEAETTRRLSYVFARQCFQSLLMVSFWISEMGVKYAQGVPDPAATKFDFNTSVIALA
jgi:hypothetical protein